MDRRQHRQWPAGRACTNIPNGSPRGGRPVNPTLTYSANGLINGDTLSGSLATAARYANVGTYAITQGTLGNANYAIAYTGSTLTITPRALSVAANSVNRGQGVANPALTYTVGGAGLVNGDTLLGSLATSATIQSAPGSYAITQGTLLASANYHMSFLPGVLTVEKIANPDTSTHTRPDTGSLATAIVTTVGGGQVIPLRPIVSDTADGGDGSRILLADPRFDGTVICSTSRNGQAEPRSVRKRGHGVFALIGCQETPKRRKSERKVH